LHVRTSIRSDIDLPVTLSVGLTEAVPSDSAETLLVRADKALYAAKHAGRNCIRTILHESSASAPSRFVTSLSGDLSGNATT
jgi:predicted signal transduction protein with EAL and GGDEF domain